MPSSHVVRAVRLLKIIELLLEKPRRAADLAEILGCSQRAVQRDLALLQEAPLALHLRQDSQWLWHLQSHREWFRVREVGEAPIEIGEDLLTTRQIAERLGIARERVYAACRAGRFAHARKPGHDWLIPSADLQAWEG